MYLDRLETDPGAMPDPEHLFRSTAEFSETVISSASGTWLRVRDGCEIQDSTSGQMSAILRHAHPEIVATINEGVRAPRSPA